MRDHTLRTCEEPAVYGARRLACTERAGRSAADRADVRLQDRAVGLADVAALDGSVRPDEERRRQPGDAVAVADRAVAVEEHRRADVELVHEAARRVPA